MQLPRWVRFNAAVDYVQAWWAQRPAAMESHFWHLAAMVFLMAADTKDLEDWLMDDREGWLHSINKEMRAIPLISSCINLSFYCWLFWLQMTIAPFLFADPCFWWLQETMTRFSSCKSCIPLFDAYFDCHSCLPPRFWAMPCPKHQEKLWGQVSTKTGSSAKASALLCAARRQPSGALQRRVLEVLWAEIHGEIPGFGCESMVNQLYLGNLGDILIGPKMKLWGGFEFEFFFFNILAVKPAIHLDGLMILMVDVHGCYWRSYWLKALSINGPSCGLPPPRSCLTFQNLQMQCLVQAGELAAAIVFSA